MTKQVMLIDYGMCNLLNVARAFEHCGAKITITQDPRDVSGAHRIVVPGVGAFRNAMREMVARGFADAVRSFVAIGRPMFGICVGMQMLFDSSEEFGDHVGLGIVAGKVRAIPDQTTSGSMLRVPHIGWNQLVPPSTDRDWHNTLLAPVAGARPAMYFVHSFAGQPEAESDRLADCIYGGHRICAALQRGSLMAVQFHPERSGEIGLRLLKHFMTI